MFSGFTEETIAFFIDLKFHNNTTFFHQEHDRYVEMVQTPFYELIGELAPTMLKIDPCMEVRPHKCLSRIHRDTRFSRDKSPYRDHLWFLFRHEAEPREKAVFFYFEFGLERLSWGMGIWGENRELMDQFRRKLAANPEGMAGFVDDLELEKRKLYLGGSSFKRIEYPPELPARLRPWYAARELYIGKEIRDPAIAYEARLTGQLKRDFNALAPVYRMFRGLME